MSIAIERMVCFLVISLFAAASYGKTIAGDPPVAPSRDAVAPATAHEAAPENARALGITKSQDRRRLLKSYHYTNQIKLIPLPTLGWPKNTTLVNPCGG